MLEAKQPKSFPGGETANIDALQIIKKKIRNTELYIRSLQHPQGLMGMILATVLASVDGGPEEVDGGISKTKEKKFGTSTRHVNLT